jgi:hypothetical protein
MPFVVVAARLLPASRLLDAFCVGGFRSLPIDIESGDEVLNSKN